MLLIIVINKINSRVLHTHVPNKSFGQLLSISPEKFKFSKTFGSGFSHIDLWFTDQNYKPLEIEGKINITLVINQSKKRHAIQFN